MSVLTDIMPAAWRRGIYIGYAFFGLVLGILDIVYHGAAWVDQIQDVYVYVGAALGLTAAANTVAVGARRDATSSTGYSAGTDSPPSFEPGEEAEIRHAGGGV